MTKAPSSPWLKVILLLVCLAVPAAAQMGPPPDPFLECYEFLDTNWISDFGYLPLNCTNLVSVSVEGENALMLDTTNLEPAFLQYNFVETNGHTNLDFGAGAVSALVISDWASADTNQNGQGPGELGYLLAAGDWSSNAPDGFWAIYVDAGGTNIYFGGVSNSVAATYVSAPISWASNSIHMIGLTYTSNSVFYLDGQLAATGGPVTIVPATNTWTNGLYIGSDASGYEQFRGIFLYMELDNSAIDSSNIISDWGANWFTYGWSETTNYYDTWLAAQGGFHLDASGGFKMPPTPTNTVNTNYAAFTNFWLSVSNNPTNVYVIVENTLSNITYLVLTNANLANSNGWGILETLLASNSVMPAPPLRLGSKYLFFKGALNFTLGCNDLLFGPAITITSPQTNLTTPASRIDVLGTVASLLPIQFVTVNGATASLNGTNFAALNIPLAIGTNQLVTVVQDTSGNSNHVTVTVIASTNQADPLELVPSVTQGYAPLAVNFTLNAAGLPGAVQSVAWDWQGDGIPDLTVSNLSGHSNTYSAGTYFPVVTVTTTQGTFSTPGGNNASMESTRVTIVADASPQIVWSQSVTGPVAIKANADGSVYVLANNPPKIFLYASNQTILRSLNLTTLGLSSPVANGFDVDSSSNVYLAMTAMQQVYKLCPLGTNSYTPDSDFNANAYGYLVSPWDVAVSSDGTAIYVSDPGTTNQIVQFNPDGSEAASISGFAYSKGLSYDPTGRLVVANSGSNQVLFVVGGSISDGFSQPAIKASGDSMVLYVTDGTNVEEFDSYGYTPIRSVPASVGLNNPRSVSIWPSMVEQRVYIADYGNNRVIAVTFPQQSNPLSVWTSMIQAVTNNNLNQAVGYFSMFTSSKYSAEFQAVGLTNVSSILSQLPTPTITETTQNFAHYYVTVTTNGVPLTFYINFSNENGLWKICSF